MVCAFVLVPGKHVHVYTCTFILVPDKYLFYVCVVFVFSTFWEFGIYVCTCIQAYTHACTCTYRFGT